MKTGALGDLGEEAVSHNAAIRKRVILRKGEVPRVMQVARSEFPRGEVAGEHAHRDMWELFLCEGGKGVMRVDGREVKLEEGVFVLVEPNEAHEIESDGDSELRLLVFSVGG